MVDALKLTKRLSAIAPRAKAKGTVNVKRDNERATFLARWCVPCVVLAVDPGGKSGASIMVPSAGGSPKAIHIAEVDTYKAGEIEAVLDRAHAEATARGFVVVLACETWGAGGVMGIKQWLGLGEARGIWKRAFAVHECGKMSRIVLINCSTWRGMMITETGTRDETGKHHKFTPDEWKRAATTALAELTEHAIEIPSADAGEAGCLGFFAARSRQVIDVLGKRGVAGWTPWEDGIDK